MSKKNRKERSSGYLNADNMPVLKKLFWIIPVLTLIIYLSISRHDFLNYDDDWMIYENTYVTNFSFEQVKLLFTEFYRGQYSPVSMTLIGSTHSIANGNPLVLKLVGLFLHIICIFLIYILFSKISNNQRLSIIATAFFALHPVQVESVAWLSASLKIGPYAVFTLAGLVYWVKYLNDEKIKFYIASLFFMILSCFSKEQAFVFPLYLILITFLLKNEIFLKKRILELIPFGVVAILFVVITYFAVKSNTQVQGNQFSLPEKLLLMSYSFVSYLKLMLFPVNLAPFYNTPETINSIKGLLLYPIITLALIALILWSIKRNKILLFGISFFLISIVLTFALQIVSIRDSLIYDRYLYLGLPGFFLAIIVASESILRRKLSIFFILILIIYAAGTIKRVGVFKNSETIWTDAIAKNYKNPLAYNNRGHYYRQNNQIEKALADYNEALKIDPNYYLTLNNRGKVYFDRGQIDIAMADFNKCLSIAPSFVNALGNRGATHAAKNNFEAALADLNRAIELEPVNLNALSNRSLTFYSMNEFEKAAGDITTYLTVKPDDADMLNLRSLSLNQLGRDMEALTDLNRAIELMPSQGVFWQNRSYLFNKAGDMASALRDLKQAQALGIQVNPAYLQMLQQNAR